MPQATANTDLKRKATARKGQATRLRNESAASEEVADAAGTRARAEVQSATARLYEAGRLVDIATGAALDARDRIAESVRPLSDPRRVLEDFSEELRGSVVRFESRGASARVRAGRDADRVVRRLQERLPV